jgi:chromosome segregation ATPase
MSENASKYSATKVQLDACKQELETLLESNNTLQVDNTTLSFMVNDMAQKQIRYDAEKKHDSEKIVELEQRMKDMELDSHAPLGNVGSLDATSPDGVMQTRIRALESELAKLRAQRTEDAKRIENIAALEIQLDDAHRLGNKFEDVYFSVILELQVCSCKESYAAETG